MKNEDAMRVIIDQSVMSLTGRTYTRGRTARVETVRASIRERLGFPPEERKSTPAELRELLARRKNNAQ